MDGTPTGYLALAFPPDRLLAYLDAPFYQILVVKQQVLFQTGVGDTAGVGGFLCRDISVRTQKFHSLGVLFLTVPACTSRQVVAYAQPFTYLFTPFDNPGIVRAQLTTEVRAVQPELAGYLRDVVFDIVQTLARFDGILVFGMGGGQLSTKRSQLDV